MCVFRIKVVDKNTWQIVSQLPGRENPNAHKLSELGKKCGSKKNSQCIYDLWKHLISKNAILYMICNGKSENRLFHWQTTKLKLQISGALFVEKKTWNLLWTKKSLENFDLKKKSNESTTHLAS